MIGQTAFSITVSHLLEYLFCPRFIGAFSVNFEIPDYWGIGKSVSRGFGTVKRVAEFGRKVGQKKGHKILAGD